MWVPETEREPVPRTCPTPLPGSGALPDGDGLSWGSIKQKTEKKLFCRSSSRLASRPQKDNLRRTEKLGLMSNEIGFTVEICWAREPRGALSRSPASDAPYTRLPLLYHVPLPR